MEPSLVYVLRLSGHHFIDFVSPIEKGTNNMFYNPTGIGKRNPHDGLLKNIYIQILAVMHDRVG